MSKYLNSTVVRIDVASEFSFAVVLYPDGILYRKPFKFPHTVDGLKYMIEQKKTPKMHFYTLRV